MSKVEAGATPLDPRWGPTWHRRNPGSGQGEEAGRQGLEFGTN